MESIDRMKRGWKVCGGVVQIRKNEEAAAAIATRLEQPVLVRFSHHARRMQKGELRNTSEWPQPYVPFP